MIKLISILAAGACVAALAGAIKNAEAAPVSGRTAPQVHKAPPDPCRRPAKQTRTVVVRGRPGAHFLNPQPLPPG